MHYKLQLIVYLLLPLLSVSLLSAQTELQYIHSSAIAQPCTVNTNNTLSLWHFITKKVIMMGVKSAELSASAFVEIPVLPTQVAYSHTRSQGLSKGTFKVTFLLVFNGEQYVPLRLWFWNIESTSCHLWLYSEANKTWKSAVKWYGSGQAYIAQKRTPNSIKRQHKHSKKQLLGQLPMYTKQPKVYMDVWPSHL